MKLEIKECLMMGLQSKGFNLDFEAKADIGGGFECYMFSNGTDVLIITGKIARSRKGGSKRMAYSHYYCQVGDDKYLKSFLDYEGIMRNPGLLTGEYGGLFCRLINKVMDYGTDDSELLVSPLKSDDSIDDGSVGDIRPPDWNLYAFYN